MTHCKKCTREVAPLDLFSGNRCVECFGKDLDNEEQNKTLQQKAQFIKTMGQVN